MTRVLITGDREYTDEQRIRDVLSAYGPGDVLIEGAARGADSIGGKIGVQRGCQVIRFPAQWNTYDAAAGNLRNTQMLDEGTPEIVHAFHNNIEASRGTADMVKQALHAKLPVILHHATGSSRVLWIVVPSKKSGLPVRIGLA